MKIKLIGTNTFKIVNVPFENKLNEQIDGALALKLNDNTHRLIDGRIYRALYVKVINSILSPNNN